MTILDTQPAIDKFDVPLYTQPEAARFLAVPSRTFTNWARGYRSLRSGQPVEHAAVVTSTEKAGPRAPAIPFVGLAEGYALSAIRRTGVPLQRIRPALTRLSDELGIAHALASRALYTDGAEVLFDFASTTRDVDVSDLRDLVVVRDGQRVLNDVVREYLQRIDFGPDGYAASIPLVGFRRARIVADVRRSFGQPIFVNGGTRLDDALSLFAAEHDVDAVLEEYGVDRREFEDVLASMIAIG